MRRFRQRAMWVLGVTLVGAALVGGARSPEDAFASPIQASTRDCIVVPGLAGKLFTSADGLTWHTRSSGTKWALNGAAATPERMVVVFGRDDPGSPIIVSTDGGQTWRDPRGQVPAWQPNSLDAVATDGHGWVAVGFKSVSDDSFDAVAYFSPDGETWKPTKLNARRSLDAVAASGTRWVATGMGVDVNRGIWATSTDGIRWQSHKVNVELSDVAWNGSQWLIAGVRTHGFNLVEGQIWTSNDGVHWTKHVYKHWYADGLGWNGKEWLAVGYGVYASADGVHWTKRSDEGGFYHIASTAQRWIAVERSDTTVSGAFVSVDGTTWNETLENAGTSTVAAACTAP